MIGGIFCILGSVLFAKKLPSLRAMVRPIYAEKGIILQDFLPTDPSEGQGT
jgi:hypothetical protein